MVAVVVFLYFCAVLEPSFDGESVLLVGGNNNTAITVLEEFVH